MDTNTDDPLNDVVTDGVRFLKSIVRFYGSERGMEVWEKLGEALGQDIKGRVFFSILVNNSTEVRIGRGSCNNPVMAIRAIRVYTGASLKVAKDIWDDTGRKIVTVEVTQQHNQQEFIKELREIGMVAN